ncbi:MAG: signal peptidase I [Pseudomonadota bacterium]
MLFRRRKRRDIEESGIPVEREPAGSWSTMRFFVTLILLAWAIRSFVVAPFSIPSGSMLPTLYIGDYLLVSKWPYGYSKYSFPMDTPAFKGRIFAHPAQRGDVVVFRHPDGKIDLIKRIIGISGDTIEVRGGAVILNGKPLQRTSIAPAKVPVSANSPCKTVPPLVPNVVTQGGQPYCLYPAYRETLPNGPSYVTLDQLDNGEADNFGPAVVPAGAVFLMGDNRDDSLDSRFETYSGGIGMVPVDHLIGRAMVNFWSTDGSASYVNPLSWLSALRRDRIGNGFSSDPQ